MIMELPTEFGQRPMELFGDCNLGDATFTPKQADQILFGNLRNFLWTEAECQAVILPFNANPHPRKHGKTDDQNQTPHHSPREPSPKGQLRTPRQTSSPRLGLYYLMQCREINGPVDLLALIKELLGFSTLTTWALLTIAGNPSCVVVNGVLASLMGVAWGGC